MGQADQPESPLCKLLGRKLKQGVGVFQEEQRSRRSRAVVTVFQLLHGCDCSELPDIPLGVAQEVAKIIRRLFRAVEVVRAVVGRDDDPDPAGGKFRQADPGIPCLLEGRLRVVAEQVVE